MVATGRLGAGKRCASAGPVALVGDQEATEREKRTTPRKRRGRRMRRLLFPARTCLLSSILEDEGHLDLRSVLRDLALFDVGCLIENSNAGQITQRLVCPRQRLADGVLPPFRRGSDDRSDSRDGHNAPPVSGRAARRSERWPESSCEVSNGQGCCRFLLPNRRRRHEAAPPCCRQNTGTLGSSHL